MKNIRLKKVYIFFASALLFIVHLPFAFAKHTKISVEHARKSIAATANSSFAYAKESLMGIYDSLNLDNRGLSREAFDEALNGYLVLKNRNRLGNSNIISIADFSKSSAKKRFFVIDIKNAKVLYNTYVAHGQNTGEEFAKSFSNENESLKSSPGFYVTAGTYTGSKGFSMYLQGQEPGINDNAYDRSIVMHAADYVSEDYIRARGYIGRSWGCPALPEKMNQPVINKIKGGTCLFIYTPEKSYQRKSKLANAA